MKRSLMDLILVSQLFMADGKGGSSVEDTVEIENDAQPQARVQRSTMPICPDPEKRVFSIIPNEPYKEMAKLVAKHVVGSNDEPYADNQAAQRGFKRKLISLIIDDPSAKIFQGTPYWDKVHSTIQNMTVADFIKRQFARSRKIAKSQFLAEFFKFKVPTPSGYAYCRPFAYNDEGFLVSEFRGYLNVKVAENGVSVAPAVGRPEKGNENDDLSEVLPMIETEDKAQQTGKIDPKKAL